MSLSPSVFLTHSKHFLFSFLILLLSFLNFSASFAENSFIETIQKTKKSFVDIIAQKTEIKDTCKPSLKVNPKTDKLVVTQTHKTKQFSRTGAGIIVDSSGLIITNIHTIKLMPHIWVKLHDESVIAAQLIKLLPEYDLALLKIDPPFKIKAIRFADSNQLTLGQEIFNIGSSKLLDNTISSGQITRLGSRNNNGKNEMEMIQVNINLYHGDSGGPLLDKDGDLIGIMVARIKNEQKASLAIPSNKIKKFYLENRK